MSNNEILLLEIRSQYKERMKDLFDELFLLAKKPQPHLFRKTTYKVELTTSEWLSLKNRYLPEEDVK